MLRTRPRFGALPALVCLLVALSSVLLLSPAGAGGRAPRCLGERVTIRGNQHPNRIVGTTRRDVIVGGGGGDLILGRGGNDLICGGSGNDELSGGDGDDRMDGGAGHDFLKGAGGNDLIVGGEGASDFVQYLGGRRPVTIDLGKRTATGWGRDRLKGVEYASGTKHDDVILGDDRRNFLFGQAGDDRIEGEDANDFVFGGPGRDSLGGGQGYDAADYTLSDSGVTVRLGDGTATGEGTDKLDEIEDVWGSEHADDLSGNSSNNHLYGWDGPDLIDGRGGDDLLVPGVGDDEIEGGVGADYVDYFYGKLANFLATNPVDVNLATGVATGSGSDLLLRIENISGTNRNDVLTGDDGANAVFAYAGNDELFGLEGNDWIDGGSGVDSLNGGPGRDWCTTGESWEECESSRPPPEDNPTIAPRLLFARLMLSDWSQSIPTTSSIWR
jgi:Ca2+-binding RTX toxin-like protein